MNRYAKPCLWELHWHESIVIQVWNVFIEQCEEWIRGNYEHKPESYECLYSDCRRFLRSLIVEAWSQSGWRHGVPYPFDHHGNLRAEVGLAYAGSVTWRKSLVRLEGLRKDFPQA